MSEYYVCGIQPGIAFGCGALIVDASDIISGGRICKYSYIVKI